MQKLTLPLEVGKKYLRRDGKVITAKEPHPCKTRSCIFIGEGTQHDDPTGEGTQHDDPTGKEHAWKDNGTIYGSGNSNSYDIVADVPNTYTVEQVLLATEDVTAIELKSRIPAVQKHLDNLTDPDYTEFLRLQAKFKN